MRKPDYERGNVRLYCGDCLEILPGLEGVDAVVTDPPYGISHPCNFNGRGRSVLAQCNDYPDVANDDKPFDPSPLLAMNVPTVLWGGNYFADKLPPVSGWLVWDKERGDELDQATCELAWTNFVKGVRRFRHRWDGMLRASEHGQRYHPTQKPAALTEWILSLRWTPHGTILDPYMGACGTGVACVRLDRGFIGIELERKYFDIACQRVDAEFERTALIEPPPPKVTQAQMFAGVCQ